MNTLIHVQESPWTLIARRAMSSERANANQRAGSFGSNRCTTAVTVMTTVVEPAAVKRVWLSNHCGRLVPAPPIAASLGLFPDSMIRNGVAPDGSEMEPPQ